MQTTPTAMRSLLRRSSILCAAVAIALTSSLASTIPASADETTVDAEAIDDAANKLDDEGVPGETADTLRSPIRIDIGRGPRMIPLPSLGTIGWDKTDQAGFAVLTDPRAKSLTVFMHYPNGVPTTVRNGKEVPCGSAMNIGWVNMATGQSGILPLNQWVNTKLEHRRATIRTGLGPIGFVIYGSDPYGVNCPAPGDGVLNYVPTPAVITNQL